jgi:hypothetical protein
MYNKRFQGDSLGHNGPSYFFIFYKGDRYQRVKPFKINPDLLTFESST